MANTPLATASLGLDSSLAGEARLKVEEQKNLQNIEPEKYFTQSEKYILDKYINRIRELYLQERKGAGKLNCSEKTIQTLPEISSKYYLINLLNITGEIF